MVWKDTKFQLLRIGYDDTLFEDTHIFSPQYSEVITQNEYVKDLGILLDSELNFRHQRMKLSIKQIRNMDGV